jgi:outer membrane receptor protein involved in Fe transport
VSLGVSNLFDEDYIIVGLGTPNIGALQVMPDRGREWFLTARASF